MPVIRAQNLARQLAHGDRLKIIATDPGALQDLPSWARINGHKVLSCDNIEGLIQVEIELVKEIA